MAIRIYPELTVDEEMETLRLAGYTTGTLNDRMFTSLVDSGYFGTLSDMLNGTVSGITITADPVVTQSDQDPQGTATVSSSATSADSGFAIVSSEWVHSIDGDVQSNASPYTKTAGAGGVTYTLRLRQVCSATGLPNKTVYSNILTVDALSITAVVTPAMSALYNTQTVEDATNYATMVGTGNFTSNAGTISTVTITATGDAVAVTTPLTAGYDAGFDLDVEDSAGNIGYFTADTIEVEAMYAAEAISGGTIEFTAASTLPLDAVLIVPAVVVDSVDQLVTMGDIRDIMAGIAVGFLLPTITYVGAEVDLVPTDVLTGVNPVWGYSGSIPTPTLSWESDGTPIGGATSQTFTLTATEQGTDVTFVFDPDGVGAGVAIESAAVTIEAAAGGPVTGTLEWQGQSTSGSLVIATDLTGVATNEPLYIGIVMNSSGRYPTSVDIGGVTESTPLVEMGASVSQTPNCSWWKVLKPAGDTPNLTITQTVSTSDFAAFIYTADLAVTVSASLANEMSTSGPTLVMNTNTVTDELVLMIGGEDRGTGNVTLAGVTSGTRIDHLVATTFSANSGAHTATTDETPRTLSVGNTGGNTSNMGGAVIVLGA